MNMDVGRDLGVSINYIYVYLQKESLYVYTSSKTNSTSYIYFGLDDAVSMWKNMLYYKLL